MAKNDGHQINDLIFKELIKRGYSLEGNTRIWNISDSKLWYLTDEQAQSYLDMENSKRYYDVVVQREIDFISENIDEILQQVGSKSFNIIDLGCGDGKKVMEIIKLIKSRKPGCEIKYCPVDISKYLVEKAKKTFSNNKLSEVIDFEYNVSDFENLEKINTEAKKVGYKRNLILLLGRTLENFEINEFLYMVRSSIGNNDVFLSIVAINDGKQEERAKAFERNQIVTSWFIHIPLQLGLNKNGVKLKMRWKNSRIEAYYIILKDKEIKYDGRTIKFLKGDQIVVASACKHNLEDLKTFMNIHFNEVQVIVSNSKSRALSICKK